MNITIVGAGNMGLAITGYLAIKKHYKITLYTEKDVLKNGPLMINEVEDKWSQQTDNFIITSDKATAFEAADVILCTYPAFLRKQFIEENGMYFKNGSKIGFIPGYGGSEYCCQNLIDNGVIIFGLQRVPYVARAHATSEGMVAGILSKKSKLYIAAIPNRATEKVRHLLEDLFDIPCIALREYLSVTLAPSNPLLHISGLYNVFKDYKIGIVYDERYRFYEKWNNDTSALMLKYDDELQKICSRMAPMDLSEVVPLKIYYEAPSPEKMTKKLKSIESFNEVMVPMKKTKEGFLPDFNSRMFIEDFPYGACIIKAFALMVDVSTPTIDLLLRFYNNLTGICYFREDGSLGKDAKNTGIPFLYGLNKKEDIIEFYHQ